MAEPKHYHRPAKSGSPRNDHHLRRIVGWGPCTLSVRPMPELDAVRLTVTAGGAEVARVFMTDRPAYETAHALIRSALSLGRE